MANEEKHEKHGFRDFLLSLLMNIRSRGQHLNWQGLQGHFKIM